MKMSDAVRKTMQEKDITPSELARMTGYSPQYIHNLLEGNRRWNETTMERTCHALGLELQVINTG